MESVRDVVIIGAGAAGLTAAQHAAEENLDCLLIEEMAAGGQALVINRLQNFPGFPEPLTGVDFSMRLEKQTRNFGIQMLNTSVTSLHKENNLFYLATRKGQIIARSIILATGAAHRTLGIAGEMEFNGKGVSYCASCDGPFFKNKRIVVIGGGDSACDEALYLSGLSDRVTLIHRGPGLQARAGLVARVDANPGITVRSGMRVTEIYGQQKVQGVILEQESGGTTKNFDADAVFIFVGSNPRSELAVTAEKDDEGRVLTNELMESSMAGFFAAGEVRNTPFRQLVVSAGEGAIAARSAARYISTIADENFNT